ncbi:MAG TPA: alpha/beta hydrolase-fold protein [Bacilli bacterium]|nr:alpha/beta hydrolase-fold protein [Bacilli bacterium]
MPLKNRSWLLVATLFALLTSCTTSLGQDSSLDTSVYDGPTVNFKANIPIDIAATSVVVIAGNFNSWNPFSGDNVLTEIDAYNYEITIEFDVTLVGTSLEYKYVLLFEDQTEGPWTNVEGSSTGGEIGNRTYTLREGIQTVNDTIASFKNNTGQTTLSRGTLRKVVLDMPLYEDGRQRTIRIWLPDGYSDADTATRYPVMYMHDGQNLFDAYTGFAGEWGVDETIGALMDVGYGGSIVVGIDNSSDRLNELSPSWPRSSAGSVYIKNPSGEKYASFIVDVVKPYIDANFNTNPSRETTGIGGSSMGGVISFYMALQYPDVFGYGMLFSTAMYIYEANMSETFIASKSVASSLNPRLYIYAGGQEPTITRYVDDIKNALIDQGYPIAHINTLIDPNLGHNEAAWAHYFPIAYRWLVDF